MLTNYAKIYNVTHILRKLWAVVIDVKDLYVDGCHSTALFGAISESLYLQTQCLDWQDLVIQASVHQHLACTHHR